MPTLQKMMMDAENVSYKTNLPVPYDQTQRYKTGTVGKDIAFRTSTQANIAAAGRVVPVVGGVLIGVDLLSKYALNEYEDLKKTNPEMFKHHNTIPEPLLEKPIIPQTEMPLPKFQAQEFLWDQSRPTLLGVLALGNTALTHIASQLSTGANASNRVANNTALVANRVEKVADTLGDLGTTQVGLMASLIEQITYLSDYLQVVATKQISADDLKVSEMIEAVRDSGQTVANTIASLPLDDMGVTIYRSDEEKALTTSQLKESTFNTTEIQLQNLGDDGIPSATPQMLQALHNATAAQKNSDTNTFELENDDFDLIFQMPDLGDLFNLDRKSERVIQGLNG